MNDRPDIDARRVREHCDCRELAVALGVRLVNTRGENWRGYCPMKCKEGGRPTFSLNEGTWYCFRCDARGDAFDLVAVVDGLDVRRDFKQVVRRTADLMGLSRRAFQDSPWTASKQVQGAKPRETAPRDPDSPCGLSLVEVDALWQVGQPLRDDTEVLAYLRSRGVSDAMLAELTVMDEARVLPPWAPLVDLRRGLRPPWAQHAGRAWHRTGWRLMVPLYMPGYVYDARNGGGPRPVTLRARWCRLDAAPPHGLKCPTPRGSTVKGAVMANEGARIVLQYDAAPLDVAIAEGEIDFLCWAAQPEWAVFGIVAGSWTPEIAARVPSGSRVVVRTDNDPAGERYFKGIYDTIGRRCDVYRSRPGVGHE
ncbi:MAG: hypothetical protein EP329_09840 [Deltaproteobacteria bacterium]|nr:MAG: hypothetical protein EP329_09840 [Deltaproteobacteria bacterium]